MLIARNLTQLELGKPSLVHQVPTKHKNGNVYIAVLFIVKKPTYPSLTGLKMRFWLSLLLLKGSGTHSSLSLPNTLSHIGNNVMFVVGFFLFRLSVNIPAGDLYRDKWNAVGVKVL